MKVSELYTLCAAYLMSHPDGDITTVGAPTGSLLGGMKKTVKELRPNGDTVELILAEYMTDEDRERMMEMIKKLDVGRAQHEWKWRVKYYGK